MYDETDDILVKNAFKVECGGEDSGFVGGIYKYKGGVPKLQISRFSVNKKGEIWLNKLGRLTIEELTALLPHIQEALTMLGEWK